MNGSAANVTSNPNPNPLNPTPSDGGESESKINANSSPPVVKPGFNQIFNSAGREFASTIYRELRTFEVIQPNTQQGHSELGCFASAWYGASKAKLKPNQLEGLWQRSIADARALARKPRKRFKKSREAVWRYLFNRRLAAIKRDVLSAESGFG